VPEKKKHSKVLEKLINNDFKDFLKELFEDNTVDAYTKTTISSCFEGAKTQLEQALNILKAYEGL